MRSQRRVISSAVAIAATMIFCVSGSAQYPTPTGSSAKPGPSGFLNTPGQNLAGMHIYLWGGLKSHGEGQHDYPQWLADWSKLLTKHGAMVDGAFHPPSAADLEHTD